MGQEWTHPTHSFCSKPLPVTHPVTIQDGGMENLVYLALCYNTAKIGTCHLPMFTKECTSPVYLGQVWQTCKIWIPYFHEFVKILTKLCIFYLLN